jgi:hypothetical protein
VRALRAVLAPAVVAGLIAGALAAVFHQVLTEPVIDRAIAAEAARPGHAHAPPVVSRQAQRIGLVAGLLLYGAIWGVLVGLTVHLTRGWTPPEWSAGRRGLVVGALVGWSAALFPFFKYPANPPGVGEPDTVGYRQALYVGFIVLALLGLGLATALGRQLRAGRRATAARVAPVAFYAVWAVALYALMPPNPDPVELSGAIVRPFRALSLAGLVIFWAAFAGSLAFLARPDVAPRRSLAR